MCEGTSVFWPRHPVIYTEVEDLQQRKSTPRAERVRPCLGRGSIFEDSVVCFLGSSSATTCPQDHLILIASIHALPWCLTVGCSASASNSNRFLCWVIGISYLSSAWSDLEYCHLRYRSYVSLQFFSEILRPAHPVLRHCAFPLRTRHSQSAQLFSTTSNILFKKCSFTREER